MLLPKMWLNGHTLIFNCSHTLGSMFVREKRRESPGASLQKTEKKCFLTAGYYCRMLFRAPTRLRIRIILTKPSWEATRNYLPPNQPAHPQTP